MVRNRLDGQFYQAALEGLKSYRRTAFTVEFLKEHGLPRSDGLPQMWADIEAWLNQGLNQGDDSRCLALLKYVDALKMWGRQSIFLFEIKGDEEKFTTRLSNPDLVRDLVGDVYDEPIYQWGAAKPFLAQAEHTTDSCTGARLLVFKLIEMRKFSRLIDGGVKTDEQRSTNFFIVNLRDGFAELRLQKLPRRAHRRLREERELFEEEIRTYLGLDSFFDRFEPIPLERIMSEMLRKPIYRITRTGFKSGRDAIPGMPMIVTVLHALFRNPIPSHMAAYWECEQAVLGRRPLHFRLYGNSNRVAVDGMADPCMVSHILNKMVHTYRGRGGEEPEEPEKPEKPLWRRGLVGRRYTNSEGRPRVQRLLLSTGAIAALMIWVVIEGVGNYLVEDWVESNLGGVPLLAVTLPIEVVWAVLFYGWERTKRSFRALWSMSPRRICKLMKAAKKAREGGKVKHRANDEDQDDESDSADLDEAEGDD